MRVVRWVVGRVSVQVTQSRANGVAILAGMALLIAAAFQVDAVLGMAVLGGSLIIAGLDVGVRR